MIEISVVDEKPQLVAGMRRRGHYKEIAKMLPALFEYALSHEAIIAGPPLDLWHEKSIEEAMKADEAGNAYIEVIGHRLRTFRMDVAQYYPFCT